MKNLVILIGHLGDEVKLHHFEDGGCIGRFPLATNSTYVNKQNEKITETEWHNIVVRNKGAEVCEKYLSKGDKVYVEGKMKTRKWQDDKGIDRYSTEVHCYEFKFLTTKQEKEQGSSGGGEQVNESVSNGKGNKDDDDLPF